MNLYLSLRTGFSFYCNRIREVSDGESYGIYPIDLSIDWKSQINHDTNLPFNSSDSPWNVSELIEAGNNPISIGGVEDIFVPLPFDPTGQVPWHVGDEIMNRVGKSSTVAGFFMENGAVSVSLKGESLSGDETMTVSKMADMSHFLRLKRRFVTDWETCMTWANYQSRNVTFAGTLHNDVSMTGWIEKVAMEVPERKRSRFSAYDEIYQRHVGRYDEIENVSAGETAKAKMQDAIGSDMPPRPNQLQKEGAQDLWAYYAKHCAAGTTTGHEIKKTFNSPYCNTRIDDGGYPTSDNAERLLEKKDLRSWITEGKQPERAEEDAFGLDEEASEEEKLDQFLMDDL